MELADLLSPDSVVANLRAANKKQALQDIAAAATKIARLPERQIFEALLERERLGTTGVGQGVAIPHAKFAGLDRLYGVFARLEQPVDFEAIDERPVDLIFALLAPEDAGAEHLKALARVSRLLRNAQICAKLRATQDQDALYALLTEPSSSAAG
jgi:PTS system nitrogen regulatory IIA component